MRKTFLYTAIIIVCLAGCNGEKAEKWENLFNGENLENWDKYMDPSLSNKTGITTKDLFSVTEKDGINVILISGDVNASLATKKSYENYHLRMVFKWGDEVHSKRNCGLLYHSFGDFGAAFKTWMTNIEFQMMHGNLGDTYLMNNTTAKIEAEEKEGEYYFSPGSELIQFGKHVSSALIRKSIDNEKPVGEWNTLDLYCYGQTAVHVVNGKTVMVNLQTGAYDDGNISPLTSGKIQVQSEGAELYIKTIDIKHISEIPGDILP
jgi:hypothetical protein